MRHAAGSALFAVALFSAGCGGGGGTPSPVTVTLAGESALSGTVRADNQVAGGFFVGDLIATNNPIVEVGLRSFLSFDLSPVPSGATVLSAVLNVTQMFVTGGPYATLGSIVVDQVVYGTVLDAGAYSRSFPFNQGIALSSDATLSIKSATVTAAVQLALDNASGRSQFRVRFTLEQDGDGSTDQAGFQSVGPSASQPTLLVTYRP